MMANDIWGWMGPTFSWHLAYSWGKTWKNLNQETWPDRGPNTRFLVRGNNVTPWPQLWAWRHETCSYWYYKWKSMTKHKKNAACFGVVNSTYTWRLYIHIMTTLCSIYTPKTPSSEPVYCLRAHPEVIKIILFIKEATFIRDGIHREHTSKVARATKIRWKNTPTDS